jgi:hypothetical protein
MSSLMGRGKLYFKSSHGFFFKKPLVLIHQIGFLASVHFSALPHPVLFIRYPWASNFFERIRTGLSLVARTLYANKAGEKL